MVEIYSFWLNYMIKERIVILGAGFGGLGTAIRLAKQKVQAQIILVDSRPYHLYTPWLYRIPADAWHKRERRMCEFYFPNLLKPYGDRIEFREAHIAHVNVETQHVVFESGDTLHYTHLVFALGSQTNFFGMEDVASRACTLNTPEHIEETYAAFLKWLKASKEDRKKQIVIAGAGATGVETAMELGYLRKKYKLTQLEITLVDGGPALLQRFSPYIQKRAAKRAKALGLHVLPSTLMKGVRGEQFVLKQKDQEILLSADLLLWAGGVKPNPILVAMPYTKDDGGRLLVNEYLEVKDAKQIYAIGDSGSVWDSHNECVVPPTAWAAVDQSAVLAQTILARVQGMEPSHRYVPPRRYPGVIALGGHYAAGGGYGIQVAGFIGWIAKQFIHVRYFVTVMPWPGAFRAWLTKKHICASSQ